MAHVLNATEHTIHISLTYFQTENWYHLDSTECSKRKAQHRWRHLTRQGPPPPAAVRCLSNGKGRCCLQHYISEAKCHNLSEAQHTCAQMPHCSHPTSTADCNPPLPPIQTHGMVNSIFSAPLSCIVACSCTPKSNKPTLQPTIQRQPWCMMND